jgi:hypothetical protein
MYAPAASIDDHHRQRDARRLRRRKAHEPGVVAVRAPLRETAGLAGRLQSTSPARAERAVRCPLTHRAHHHLPQLLSQRGRQHPHRGFRCGSHPRPFAGLGKEMRRHPGPAASDGRRQRRTMGGGEAHRSEPGSGLRETEAVQRHLGLRGRHWPIGRQRLVEEKAVSELAEQVGVKVACRQLGDGDIGRPGHGVCERGATAVPARVVLELAIDQTVFAAVVADLLLGSYAMREEGRSRDQLENGRGGEELRGGQAR